MYLCIVNELVHEFLRYLINEDEDICNVGNTEELAEAGFGAARRKV